MKSMCPTTKRSTFAAPASESSAAYPTALGRAFARLKQKPRVCAAYNELYELSLIHPQRTVAFVGFKDGELRPADAAMLIPNLGAPALPGVTGGDGVS